MRTILICALVCLTVGPAWGQTTFFSETFDGVTEPALPASVVSSDVSWKTSSSSSSPGSGANNGVHTGSSPGALVLGPIDLSAALDGTFSYWARRTSSYSADSLFVRASLDGSTYDVLLFGGGLPAAASTWEEISVVLPAAVLGEGSVYLQFEGRGGTSSGSNMRIDDILLEGTVNPLLIDTAFGFGANTLTWDLSGPSLGIDLGIEWAGPDTLQGLQFDLMWDDAVVSVDSVTLGSGLGTPSSWMLSTSLGTGSGSVALLGLTDEGLPPITHPSVLVMHVSPVGVVSGTVATSLTISGFFATSNTPTADELSLPNGHRTLALTLQPSLATVSFSQTTLDFGSVMVGDSTSVSLTASNPMGSADLVLSGSVASPLLLTIPPAIPSGASVSLPVWFKPTLSDGGTRSGSFSLTHNTAAAATAFEWTALVLGGRGDADGDGAFDVADLVVSLDGTVNPSVIPAAELPRHDLFPFPAGDGALDIRDLTVAIQAILRGQWPDASPLPVAPSTEPFGKRVDIVLVQAGDSLWLASPIELRGVQLELTASEELPIAVPAKRGAMLSHRFDPDVGVQRMVLLAGPSATFDPGHLPIAHLASSPSQTDSGAPRPPSRPLEVDLSAGVAVDRFGGKHTIAFRREGGLPEIPEPDLSGFGIYPNPLPLGTSLHLDLPPVDLAELTVYDVLGRRLFATSDRIRVLPGDLFTTPGTFFLRIATSEGTSKVRSIAVVR